MTLTTIDETAKIVDFSGDENEDEEIKDDDSGLLDEDEDKEFEDDEDEDKESEEGEDEGNNDNDEE